MNLHGLPTTLHQADLRQCSCNMQVAGGISLEFKTIPMVRTTLVQERKTLGCYTIEPIALSSALNTANVAHVHGA